MELNILYEDADIIVCEKPAALLSERSNNTANSLAEQIAARNGGYVGIVHRLDRGVGGLMVYAKNQSAAAKLSCAVQDHKIQKEYLAVVHGRLPEDTATLRDLLFHDRYKNKTFVVERIRAGVKEAILDYTLLNSTQHPLYGPLSLLRIKLHTGRTHQIRVQFASRGFPLLGDGKYGASGDRCPIALFSAHLSFPHPKTGKSLSFAAQPAWDFI